MACKYSIQQTKGNTKRMASKPINFSDMENYAGGEGFFPAGPARIEKARFGVFDYKKGKDNEQNVMILVAQPLNANGSDNGEARTQYYGVGKGIELVTAVKGEKGCYSQITFAEDAEYDKLWSKSDFAVFMAHLAKAQADMDEINNDITNLDGKVFEFGMYVEPARATAKVKDEDKSDDKKPKGPHQVVVVVGLVDEKAMKKAGSGKAKGKEKEEEAEEKPKSKDKGGKGKKEVSDDAEEIVQAYIEAELNDSLDGEAALGFKLGIADYAKKTLGKDADVAKAAQAELKENFGTYLKTAGWSLDGSKLSKG